jgi:hypothetical protein
MRLPNEARQEHLDESQRSEINSLRCSPDIDPSEPSEMILSHDVKSGQGTCCKESPWRLARKMQSGRLGVRLSQSHVVPKELEDTRTGCDGKSTRFPVKTCCDAILDRVQVSGKNRHRDL